MSKIKVEAEASNLPLFYDESLIRQEQIVGNREKGIPALVCFSASTLQKYINDGLFIKGIIIGPRNRFYFYGDVKKFINQDASASNAPYFDESLLREEQIVGNIEKGIPPLICFSATTLRQYEKDGLLKSTKKGSRSKFYLYADVKRFISEMEAQKQNQ